MGEETGEKTKEMTLREKVEKVIDEDIRPVLAQDGGNIAVIDVDEEKGIVLVQLLGACQGCPMSQLTLGMFVEQRLKQKVPEVKRVLPV